MSGNKNYKRGYHIERLRMNHYRALGYEALRAAGSHSHFDVLAVNSVECIHEQLKRTKKYVGSAYSKEITELKKLQLPIGCIKKFTVYIDKVGFFTPYADPQ